jgi:hypothetical protein
MISHFINGFLKQAGLYGLEKEAREYLAGGLAEGHKDSEFPKKQIEMGIDIEKEHTPDVKIRKEIAKDHLMEHKDYYTMLKKYVEKS